MEIATEEDVARESWMNRRREIYGEDERKRRRGDERERDERERQTGERGREREERERD